MKLSAHSQSSSMAKAEMGLEPSFLTTCFSNLQALQCIRMKITRVSDLIGQG